jgi:hypothetical protein
MIPLFDIKNSPVRIGNSDPTIVYQIDPERVGQVSAIIITCQIANTTDEDVDCSVYVMGEDEVLYALVEGYIIPPNNSYDPLIGNLAISGTTKLVVQGSEAGLDVVVLLVEIANAITG